MIRPNPSFLLPAFCALSALAWAQPVNAQAVPAERVTEPLMSLDVTDMDTVTEVDQLFKKVGLIYRFDDSDGLVLSKVSLHIQNASFNTVVSALATAANHPMRYAIDNGVYHFKFKRPPVAGESGVGGNRSMLANQNLYFIPLAHTSTHDFLKRMRGALTVDLRPFDWRRDPMADQIEYIIVDEPRNGFLVNCSVDGFNAFRELVHNLDEAAPPPKAKAHK